MAILFKEFKATRPVVCLIDADKSIYEVFFIVYDHAGKRYRKRFKQGINSLPINEREIQAKATADVLWEALQRGWNPLIEKYPNFNKTAEVLKLNFGDALDYALKLKIPHLSKYSVPDYRGTVRFMKKAAQRDGLLTKNIDQFERRDIRMIIATAKEQNSWSNNARNKYLTLFKSLLSVLDDQEMIKFNPAYKIKNEPTNEGLGYKRLVDDQKEQIATQLIRSVPCYFEYLMFIYQAGIRRTELLQVRISDINLRDRCITIRGGVAKANRARRIPITDDMMDILMRREVNLLPHHWYLFSNKDFAPGEMPYHPNTPTSWWRKLVIDGMGIDCKMYSLKHKGADDKIIAGLDIDVLRTLYGHRSRQMTEIYAKEVKNKYAQQIIEHAPAFAKVIKLKKAK